MTTRGANGDSRDFDFLVLGSGIAGLFYALQVAAAGRVGVVTKKHAADSATNWAQGGIAAVLSENDSFESHVQDTLVAGAGLCDETVVRHVVERGPAMIDALLKVGADFDRDVGRVMLEQIGARLAFLDAVGLSYLTLDRTLRTLSGGEMQRVAIGTVADQAELDIGAPAIFQSLCRLNHDVQTMGQPDRPNVRTDEIT